MHSATLDPLLNHFDAIADAGQVRRLGAAFARFIGSLSADAEPADAAALAVACVVLSELEGRGHSCVMLADLAQEPSQTLGWTEEQWQAVLAVSGPLPGLLEDWCALLARAPQVWSAGVADRQQPLVLDGARLYLRRYWRDETAVGGTIAARAEMTLAPPLPQVRRWLDVLFDKPACSPKV